MGLLIGLSSLLFLAACGGEEAAKGAADQEHKKSTSGDTASTNLQTGQEHKKSTSGGTASTDGLIVFRQENRRDAIFTMYPNGSHIRQITHPPKGWRDDGPAWSPDGERIAFHRGCAVPTAAPLALPWEPDSGRRRQHRLYALGHTLHTQSGMD